MSIASEITRLQGAKSTLKTKLNAKNDEQHQITNETIDEYGDFVDSIQSSNIIGATAEGESISLVNTKAMPYSDYVVEGKSEQETRSGKNLYNVNELSTSGDVSIDNDDWITINIDNSQGSSAAIANFKHNFNNLINVSTNYALFLEIKNVSGNGFLCINEPRTQSQCVTDLTFNLSSLTSNSINKYIFNTKNNFQETTNMLWSYVYTTAGKSCSVTFRISVLSDTTTTTDNFTYEPYGASPSPDYPSEIHSVADDVNLFDKEKASINSGTIKTVLDTGVRITLSSSGTFRYSGIEIGSAELLGKTITLYSTITPSSNNDGAIFLYYGNSSNMAVSAVTGGGLTNTGSKTITIANEFPTNCDRIYGLFYANRNGTGNTNDYVDYTNLKIQYGDTATPYSPYNQGTVTIKQRGTTENNDYTIQTEPLRSLPNGVKDTIEEEQHRKIGTYIFDGTEFCEKYTGSTYAFALYLPNGVPDIKHLSSVDRVLCSHLQHTTLNNIFSKKETQDNNLISTQGTRSFAIMINNYTSTTELQTYLAQQYANGTPVIIQYELAEEVIEPLTQQQATTMLDIIKTGSYEGTTNIYTDEDVKPTIGVGYYKKS